jgi:hypothetical protein
LLGQPFGDGSKTFACHEKAVNGLHRFGFFGNNYRCAVIAFFVAEKT